MIFEREDFRPVHFMSAKPGHPLVVMSYDVKCRDKWPIKERDSKIKRNRQVRKREARNVESREKGEEGGEEKETCREILRQHCRRRTSGP
jgi:hypothetical protein